MPDVCNCHVLRILAVDDCGIGDVCCLPAPAHQPFFSNSLDLSAPEEAYSSRNVRASGTLKFGYEGNKKGAFSVQKYCKLTHISLASHFFWT